MAYQYFDRNNLKGNEPHGFDLWIQRFLLKYFSERTAKSIYSFGLNLLAFFRKLALLFSLPFKFIQFWIEEFKKNSKKGN